jgi:signal peptidase II
MQKTTQKALLSTALVLIILLLDQLIKIWVKTSFYLGEELFITSWFRLVFVENNGMAFGISLGDKIYLTLFRILASLAIAVYLGYSIKKNSHPLLLSSIALILAGAVGNIIDCIFYGVWFDYAPYFYGKVVDMFYFPLIEGHYWDWLPAVGGESFVFFAPVFNLADSAICIGVALLFIFESKFAQNEA